jgi:hypothetical protein
MAYVKEGNVFRPILDGGSPKYWEQQREGFQRIAEWRDAVALAEKECSHVLYEKADELMAAVVASPGAVRILGAHKLRVHRPYWNSWPVILGKNGYATAREIPIFGEKNAHKHTRPKTTDEAD